MVFFVQSLVDQCLLFCHFYFGHCIVCSSSIYGFWLHLWYLLVIVLSVLLRFTASGDTFSIFWPLYFCSFLIYGFWLHLWYLQTFLTYVRKTSLMKNLSFNILDWLVCYFNIFLVRWYFLFMMTSASKRMSILNF